MQSSEVEALAENKVLILYVLSEINKDITNQDLFELITSINNINYFYFQQFLNDLIESHLVVSFTKDEEAVLTITTEGKNALSLTNDLLPGIVKLKADNILKEELKKLTDKAAIVAEYIPQNEKEYIIKCKVIEDNEVLFEVKTIAGSQERAKKIISNWQNKASTIYPQILDLLISDE